MNIKTKNKPIPNFYLRSESAQKLFLEKQGMLIKWGMVFILICLLLVITATFIIQLPEKLRIKGIALIGSVTTSPNDEDNVIIPVLVNDEACSQVKKGFEVILSYNNALTHEVFNFPGTVNKLDFSKEKNIYIMYVDLKKKQAGIKNNKILSNGVNFEIIVLLSKKRLIHFL